MRDTSTAVELHISDYDAFVDASLSVLRRYEFKPDYVDRWRGLILTEPTTSGQWFEPWRVDARGSYQAVESSLHTLRRSVRVDILPAQEDQQVDRLPTPLPAAIHPDLPGAGDYRVQVRVEKERYHAPARQVTTASGALAMYSTRVPTQAGLRGRRSQTDEWVPLGRDVLLEEYLLDKLIASAGARAAEPDSPPTRVDD